MLYDIIVAPIEMIVDWVFLFSTSYMAVLGVMGAIVCVSVSINFLTLPIYNVADKIQENERNIQKKLAPWVAHIKRAFKGDERFMMLQTYYREEGYSPIYALRSSISVLIQIPFFMAAYHYLSNNELLQEGGFLFVKNLGEPDALFSVGSFAINVLPIFMTLINVVSGIVYTKGFPVREKVQVYGLAAVFLVLLYNSPSGLVLYWIMNNVFSLCKNFVKKTKNPVRTTVLAVCILLLAVLIMSVIVNPESFGWKKQFLLLFVAVCIAATLFSSKAIAILKNKFALGRKCVFDYTPLPYIHTYTNSKQKDKTNFFLFLFSAIGLALLAGFLLPSSVIATSPTEFSFLGQTESPLSYIYSSVCVFAGFFVLWPVVIYKMFSGKVRKVMPPLFFVAFVCALLNAYVFKHDYGTLNATFILDNPDVLKNGGLFISFVPFVAVVIVASIYVLGLRFGAVRFLQVAVFSVCLAMIAFGVYKTKYIEDEFIAYGKVKKQEIRLADASIDDIEPIYHLSKDGKNVVVLFLDMANGIYLPYLMQELPEIKSRFNGFVYYPNAISLTQDTLTSTPSLLGGYEYVLDKINSRKDELLKDKHNEAISVMPMLFTDAGFDVTLTDIPYQNYSYGESIFSKYDNVKDINVNSEYLKNYMREKEIDDITNISFLTNARIKKFSFLQIFFPIFRKNIYSIYSTGINFKALEDFLSSFFKLYYFRNLTDFKSKNAKGTFHLIHNLITHMPYILNNEYDAPLKGYNNYKESEIHPYKNNAYFHSFAAALKQISLWLDYLRDNDCYDNTRIIIVSDHGVTLDSLKEFSNFSSPALPAGHNIIFMVKDFSKNNEFAIDNSFVTSADTLYFAKDGLNISNTNPFTKTELIQEKENGVKVYPTHLNGMLEERALDVVRKINSFPISYGYHVKDNIFDESNWTPIEYKEN